MKVTRKHNLAAIYPEIANQWHPNKNGKLKPIKMAPKSGEIVWWVCNKGHEWRAKIASRVNGRNCPICNNENRSERTRQIFLKKSGSMAKKYPEVAKEWHPTLNLEKTPSDFPPHSGEKVWWKCSRGHEWEAVINDRTGGTRSGTTCPICKGAHTSRIEIRLFCELNKVFDEVFWREQIDKIECDLFLPNYDLAIELDGYPWHERISKRDLEKNTKLKERGIQVLRIRDDRLGKLNDEDLLYENGENEVIIIIKILEKIKNVVQLSEEDYSSIIAYINSRELRNNEEYLKITSILPAPVYEKSLEFLRPRLASEWDYDANSPLTPAMFSHASNQKVKWICKNGHKWEAMISARTGVGTNCPVCYGKDRGEINRRSRTNKDNVLSKINPRIASEWNYKRNGSFRPDNIAAKSNLKFWWICRIGHEWVSTPHSRVSQNSRCPYCTGRRYTAKFNQRTFDELTV